MTREKMTILRKLEEGEISVKEAEEGLRGLALNSEETPVEEEETSDDTQVLEPVQEPVSITLREERPIITRRDRMLTLAEQFGNWQPDHLCSPLPGASVNVERYIWPWEENGWQWLWRNFEHPVHVDRTFDVADGSELAIVLYNGDMSISGWDEPQIKIGAALFDLRIGRDERIVRIAASTGDVHIWLPKTLSRVSISVQPGDLWLKDLGAQSIEILSISGDIKGEGVNGQLVARAEGGDIKLKRYDGKLKASTRQGHINVQEIRSSDVNLVTSDGSIWLGLDTVTDGSYHCSAENGDVDLQLAGDSACEIAASTSDGGRIAPILFPWKEFYECSDTRFRGLLRSGGAMITLESRAGEIYVHEK